MNKRIILFCGLWCALLLQSCDNTPTQPPVTFSDSKSTADELICVPYTEVGGVKTLPVMINGRTMDMIFDPGCSGVTLSLLELLYLCKSGVIDENDIIGTSYSQLADGSVVEDVVVRIDEIRVGGRDGLVVRNVEAMVSPNLEGSMLLGNDVLDEAQSVEVDNVKQTINFKKRV